MSDAHGALFDRVAAALSRLQHDICAALTTVDGAATFSSDRWERPGGGGGVARVLEGGAVFEKAGVNWSCVDGELPEAVAADMPGDGRAFRACGVSLVIHPRSPRVPTTHANFRMFVHGERAWFGGGADLTPYYLEPDDAAHFHRTLAGACDAHAPVGDYPRFKAWCDSYFFLPHRGETRGVGGIFFDYLGAEGEHPLEDVWAFVAAAGAAFVPAYVPIVERRRHAPYGDAERTWQLQRRGRYVEFNLVYDRGTLFGLRTGGRIESILMSLPPQVRWDYDVQPAPGSPEAALVAALRPTDWLGRAVGAG
ncbi:MAG: oxygen-dependent coproporphyrinogen oxidase [Kofleriaceae bacterium]